LIDAWYGLQWLALLAQAAPAPAPAGKGGGGGIEQIFASPILPFLLIGIVFYFLMMRPEQKKRKEQEKLLTALKKNDHVVTIGGIYGTIVNAAPGSTYVTVRVDDSTNTRLRMLRSAISRVGSAEEIAENAKESK
jgi:preprotein translocase subunit YajC